MKRSHDGLAAKGLFIKKIYYSGHLPEHAMCFNFKHIFNNRNNKMIIIN